MNRAPSRCLKAVIACGAMFVQTATVWAKPPGAAGVTAALKEAEAGQNIHSRDYVLGRKLAADGEARDTFNVKKGVTYLVLGACDDACNDIDIVVEDAAGHVLGNDEVYGADPFVVFASGKTGRVFVIVAMKDCGEDACGYGLGFYALASRASPRE